MNIRSEIIRNIVVVIFLVIAATLLNMNPVSGQSLPDLIILELNCDPDADEIAYTIGNSGTGIADAGFVIHYVYTSSDGSSIAASDQCSNALMPGEAYQGVINVGNEGIDLKCGMEVQVCIDISDSDEHDNLVIESNETNNCLTTTCVCEDIPGEGEPGEELVWCCGNGEVQLVPASVCEQMSGSMYANEQEALMARSGEGEPRETELLKDTQAPSTTDTVVISSTHTQETEIEHNTVETNVDEGNGSINQAVLIVILIALVILIVVGLYLYRIKQKIKS